MMLPFQLWASLRWITIPGCIFAAYIILGMSEIGSEIENPFGHDVNDLPLEAFCEELEMDIDNHYFTACAQGARVHEATGQYAHLAAQPQGL